MCRRHTDVWNTWDSKCLALIAQVVRAFGMNPKIGGSSLSQVETFSLNLGHFHKNIRSWVENAVAREQLTFKNVNFTSKITSYITRCVDGTPMSEVTSNIQPPHPVYPKVTVIAMNNRFMPLFSYVGTGASIPRIRVFQTLTLRYGQKVWSKRNVK